MRSHWWDVAAAVILSLATLASAWSGYQSVRWSGEKVKANRAAMVALSEATRQSDVANRQLVIDVTVFTSWLEARSTGDETRSSFLRDRFRPDFVPAFTAWIQQVPPGATPPGSPFDLDAYRLPATGRVDRLLEQSRAHADEADDANQIADNFVLIAVLYASVLFFAGIASTMSRAPASHLAVALSLTMFVVATAVMLTFPTSIGF